MNGLGHRVALLRHLIVFSLRGLDLGFIRTHVFHCIGVGCSFQSSCPRQADQRFRSAPRFPCETTHALQQHQNRPYKILILQELVLIILEFVDACLNEIIRFIGAGRHLIPSNINRFFVVSQNHHILVNIITALLCCRNVGLVENRSIMDGIRTICRRWSERDSRTPDTTDDPARNRFRLWPAVPAYL